MMVEAAGVYRTSYYIRILPFCTVKTRLNLTTSSSGAILNSSVQTNHGIIPRACEAGPDPGILKGMLRMANVSVHLPTEGAP